MKTSTISGRRRPAPAVAWLPAAEVFRQFQYLTVPLKLDTTRIYREAWERSGLGGDRAADAGAEREAAAEFSGDPDGSAG